ncbi:MAG: hypothetical protein ABI307_00765 [Mycobacterium sp.]
MTDEPAGETGETADDSDPGFDPSGVPTFESVREKVETRYRTSLGAAELDADSQTGRTVEEQYRERRQAAAQRLVQIRESMHEDKR